jgi:hypothetical protein
MRVLNRMAHREEQFQPFPDRHPLPIAVLCDGYTLDVLHYEVRPALGRGACVDDSCNIRVVHHRQRLALVREASEYLAGVHPEFDDFKRYTAANGFALLGQVHSAHTPFAERSKDVITAEIVITGCPCRCIDGLSSGFVRANRTIERAQDQTLRAQSGGIAGSQFLSALRAVWHLDQTRRSYFKPFKPFAPGAVTFCAAFPYSGQMSPIRTGRLIN